MFTWLWELLSFDSERYPAPPVYGSRHIDLVATICAWDLLKRNLTAEQANQLRWTRAFEVIGGATGRRYRIRHGSSFNVDLLDDRGLCDVSLCFRPRGNDLPVGDIMLAQKNALELFELEALKIANLLVPAGKRGEINTTASPRLRRAPLNWPSPR